jgi:hypothetical protein
MKPLVVELIEGLLKKGEVVMMTSSFYSNSVDVIIKSISVPAARCRRGYTSYLIAIASTVSSLTRISRNIKRQMSFVRKMSLS